MFGGGFRAQKLRVSLKLAINRFKHLEKKKTENALKARKEIADYLAQGKDERARIRVEHIIREDYLVEAMEILEMYCDLLLARFGLIETMKTCDDGLLESVCTLIWVTPRLSTDVAELRQISEQLALKYGKPFADQARANKTNSVNERIVEKMSVQAPRRSLVENYLVEIGKSHNIPYEPDPAAFLDDDIGLLEEKLDFGGEGNNAGGRKGGGGGMSGGGGGGGDVKHSSALPPALPYPVAAANPAYPPPVVSQPYQPPSMMPQPSHNASPPYSAAAGNGPFVVPGSQGPSSLPPPSYHASSSPASIPPLPQVPTNSLPKLSVGSGSAGGEDVDFDELTRRFEELKKKK
ncbi:IST1 homolog [Corticium candelabrum]|uniref:IST1 homolog n=1 Tax=Corticium candelabrum TaxID=121492 RepID=UPI002E2713C7|nr:IST1 homolog [Corticium candelabrum]